MQDEHPYTVNKIKKAVLEKVADFAKKRNAHDQA